MQDYWLHPSLAAEMHQVFSFLLLFIMWLRWVLGVLSYADVQYHEYVLYESSGIFRFLLRRARVSFPIENKYHHGLFSQTAIICRLCSDFAREVGGRDQRQRTCTVILVDYNITNGAPFILKYWST